MRRYLLLFLFIISCLPAFAQQYLVTGKIIGSRNVPVPFATVYIQNSTYGSTANENGEYLLRLSPGTYQVIYRVAGYKQKIIQVTIAAENMTQDVELENETYELRGKGDTGAFIDPATEMVRKAMEKRNYYLKEEVKSYSCAVYIKGVQRLVSAPKKLMRREVAKAIQADTGKRGIFYQSEAISQFNFHQRNEVKEELIALKTAGLNPAFSYNKASDFKANFYEKQIRILGLSSHSFVSPIAPNAMSFYKYKFLGYKIEDGVRINKIQVIPKRTYGSTFEGNIYLINDSWRLYGVDLMLTKKSNYLNLVDTLRISQEFVPLKNNVWMPLTMQLDFKGKVLGFKFRGYYLGIYNHYNIDTVFKEKYFNGEVLRIDTFEVQRDSARWPKMRPVPLTESEAYYYYAKDKQSAHQRTDQYLDSLQHRKNIFYPIPYTIFNYSASSKDNKDSLSVYPFNQTIYYNTVEGLGINLRVRLSRTYSEYQSLSITPAVRYGFASKLFSANVNSEYIYGPQTRSKFFGGIGSDILDLNNVGTRSLFFNTLSTLFSERNFVKYYRSEYAQFGYQRELINGLIFKTSLNYASRTQLYNNAYYTISSFPDRHLTSNNPLMPDAPPDDRSFLFPKNQALTFNASFTYTFDQRYVTRPTIRVLEPSPYPKLTFTYRKGVNGILGSDVNYDFVSIQASKDAIPVGLFGAFAFKITAGDFFNRSNLYFMDYNHFLGNQGTTIDPTIGSFHFLPFYTFSTSGGFLEAHAEHNFAGYFLNKVPFLRKLKLDEVVGVNYLDLKTNPNYIEFYAGLQRLIFRVDYGVSYAGNKKYLQGFRIFYGIK